MSSHNSNKTIQVKQLAVAQWYFPIVILISNYSLHNTTTFWSLCSRHFSYIMSFNPFNNDNKVELNLHFIDKKTESQKVKWSAKYYSPIKCQKQEFNLFSLLPNLAFIAFFHRANQGINYNSEVIKSRVMLMWSKLSYSASLRLVFLVCKMEITLSPVSLEDAIDRQLPAGSLAHISPQLMSDIISGNPDTA